MAEIHKYSITYSYGGGHKKTVYSYATTMKIAVGQFKRTGATIHDAHKVGK